MRKLYKFFIALALFSVSIIANAQGTVIASGDCGANGNNLTWTLTSDSVLTISGSGAMTRFLIAPAAIPVPWDKTRVKTLIIGDSVTTIGDYAFSTCNNLKSEITIPESITLIGDWAFYNCGGLHTLNFNAINCTKVGIYCWWRSSTGMSTITNVNIGNNVVRIPDGAFHSCNITSVIIPNSVTVIGNSAFYNCNLTEITIPHSVDSIGIRVFENNGLTTVNFNATNCRYMGGSSFYPNFQGNSNFTTLNIGSNVTTIPEYAFRMANLAGALVIPNSVTSIGNNAFASCWRLTSLTLPNSITSIEASAFSGCSGLIGTLTIPNSVTSIGVYAFAECTGLTEVIIPNSVTSIRNSAFFGCTGLTKIIIPSSVALIGQESFGNCRGLLFVTSYAITPPEIDNSLYSYWASFLNVSRNIPVYVPCGSVNAYQTAWNYFRNIQAITDTIPIMISINHTICGNETYTFGGQILNQSGVYTDTITSSSCSDIITTLNLVVNSISEITIFDTICENILPYIHFGFNVNTTGTHSITLQNINDCDSIVTLNLTVLPTNNTIIHDTISENSIFIDSIYPVGDHILIDTLQNSQGCDSIVILNLTVLPSIPAPVELELTAESGVSTDGDAFVLTWNYTPETVAAAAAHAAILRAANQEITFKVYRDNVFVAEVTEMRYVDTDVVRGNTYCYKVRVTETNGITSGYSNEVCAEFSPSGLENILAGKITLFPNPVKNELRINSEELRINSVEILDITGKKILDTQYLILDTNSLQQGVYLIKIYTEKGVVISKIVKR